MVCPLAHYLAVGWLDGKDPSLLFSTGRYLEYNADVASSGMNPLVHFVRYGLDSNRKFNFDLSYTQFNKFKDKVIKENLFNQDYYLTVYSDVPKNHALEHYLAKGYKEGKNPSIFFETNCFLENNKDIAESDLNPLVFYVEKALNSERKVVANLNLSKYKNFRKYIHEQGFFDDEFYLSQCSSKIIDPIDHYLKIGWKKGKNPSKLFSTTEYFNYNHDVEEVGINPLLHYVQYGHAQDRIMSYGLTFEEFDDFSAFVYDEKLFDDKYYLNQCENSNLIENPLLHYLRVGYKLGYDPSILFSTNHYKEQYKFVEYKNRNPLVHYWKATTPENMLVKFYSTLSELKTFREKVIETGLFDEEFYRKQFSYPIKMDILDHYITIGSKENKRPSIFFDQENYLKNNPDVLLSFKNPLIHYVLFAFNSNRKINHDLSFSEYKEFRKFVYEKGLFNDDYYLNSIDEKDILDPLEHYLKNSFTEKNNPSWFFNTKRYIKEHPDLEENDKIPLIDYVMDTIDVYNTINNSGLFDEEYYLEQAGHSFYVTNDPLMHFITTGVRWGFDPNRTFSINKYKEIYVDVDESKQNPLYHYLIRGKRELRDSFMSLNTHLQKFDSRYSIQSCLNVINALNNKISIIIPIYNAYEETRDCIISVLRNTHINYELILINDCSTDKRIDELLTSLESIKNIKIIRNDENQGFVKNVNLGMKLSENDVVLLNSDTIVTPHWLSHLVYSAYLSNDVGTVTPFSNSSDISIPELGSIKDFKYLNKSAYQIDKLSFNNNLSAPTGNGFCLFIKRELIEDIGYFDESFGRGYGEETDFTFRAYKNGWINVRNDAVFVYHRRHASFNEEDSNTLKQENKKLLEERYDDLYKLWDEFVSSHKIKDSVGRIKYNFVGNKDSERILYVTGLTNQKPILDDNFIKMKSKYDCFVLALDAKQIKLGVIQDSRFVLYNKWIIDSKWDKNKFIKLYVNVLLNLKIDLLYIKYLYTFYNPNNQDMSIFIKLLSLFEIPVLYEATVNSEELLENIDSSLHPMDSFEDLILKKSKEIDFNRYKMVVYTAITGNYDELVTPSVINPKFDYVCFTDNPNLKSNCWDIRLMEESELDGIRKARRYKILPHKYLKEYDYSFWIDANFDIIGDIEEYINKYSVNKKLLAIKHDIRDDIYDEADVCIHLEKDDPLIINKQIDRYKQQNYPKHNGLIASGILFRNHHDKDVIQLMNDWYSEVYNYSRRDQLSFNYVCWKNNFVYDESPEFYFKNQYFQRLLHVSTDSLSLTYNEENVDKILESFEEKTSIIVPIYNAYEETKACIESILNYTTIPYDLYLIDDCSTDERIKDLLSSYESYSDIHVITNKVNQGFVKNINLGFEKSSNDVVILNSDTEVTPKWLQKLKITAYSRKNIATVTPISNNAGAFSVPKKDEDNEIDSELGLLATSNIIEKISKKDKIYVPTGNGFCMYIRRDAIYDVGFFDEIFGMGYCEENDFCMRALKKNWLHTVDFSTFIYHKHNVSFSSMKEKLFEENREILEEKHPEYKYELLNLVNSLDFNNLRDNISRTLTCTQKFKFNIKRILYLIHEGTGGTLHTSIDLMKNLPENIEAYLLTAGKDSIKLYKFSQKIDVSNSSDNDDEFLQHLYLISSWEITSDYTIKNPFNTEFRKIYFNVLNELKIDLVHIRHLIRHSFDMPYVAKKLGIPVVLSFHDFYYICPSHNLLDDKEEYCGGHCTKVYSNSGQCNISAGLNVPTLKTFVQTWRKQVKEMFENCDAFVTTSQSAYDLYTEFYPELKDKLFSIIEHGRDIQTPNSVINLPEFKDDESIRIVFPGHINANKGAALIKDIKKYDKNNLLEFHYMGNLNPKYKLDEIGIHHGYYKRSEFCKEIHEIKPHFIGLLSIWPETYCHTLTEGWSCGIPVISLDIGALGERIHKNGGGFFIENDGKKAYDKIIEISENYEKYKEVINGIPSIKFKTTKEMTEEYIRLYEKYVDLD
ncbi:MAG: glycosyltransferase [Methanosphaera sp.]|nr:glycosyltransferase [Methanosphaera sp.]